MLKNLSRTFAALACLSVFSVQASQSPQLERSGPVFHFKKTNKQIINEYLKIHKRFSKKMCKPGTEPKFWELYRSFRGDGNFIPILPNGELDKLTINKFLPELELKEKWIRSQIKDLKKVRSFKTHLRKLKKLDKQFKKLLSYKKDYFEAKSEADKAIVRNKSKYEYIVFKDQLKSFLEEIPFLTSYRYPVDHMDLRINYDKYKSRDDMKGKIKSNQIYFYRKIVQDGAQNPDHKKSDRFLRANIDTVKLRLDEPSDFITEDMRFDTRSVLKVVKAHLKRGKKRKLSRLNEWLDRVKRAQKYYTLLRDNKVESGKSVLSGTDAIEKKAKARYILKDYVLKKERDSFNFWKNQTPLMRSLFAIETILFNEVGSIDGRDGLERRDVTQVVINRSTLPQYYTITPRESIHGYLTDKHNKDISEYPWLGAMFKEGEFSFTYFFIHGNSKIYCPDMTRRGRFLRKENLKIGLELLRKPNYSFNAVRYFSRASMLGSIDMAKIWSDFKAVEERPGLKAGNRRSLERLYKRGKFDFLYDFTGPKGTQYKVVEIKNKNYVMPQGKLEFFKHRNPHYFRYFEKVD